MRKILIVAHALSTSLMIGWLLVADAAADTGISLQRQTQLIHLLRQDCGSCHGMTLKGGLGSPLLPGNLIGKPDELLVDTILNGRPDTAMPPWRGELSPAEAVWLVEQLREGLTDAQH
jgi:cytochrome c55X